LGCGDWGFHHHFKETIHIFVVPKEVNIFFLQLINHAQLKGRKLSQEKGNLVIWERWGEGETSTNPILDLKT